MPFVSKYWLISCKWESMYVLYILYNTHTLLLATSIIIKFVQIFSTFGKPQTTLHDMYRLHLLYVWESQFATRPTLNVDKPSATLDPWIPTWSIMSPNNHLSFSKSYMLACQGSRNSQKSDVSNHSVVCWHGSVAFPILPIDIKFISIIKMYSTNNIDS